MFNLILPAIVSFILGIILIPYLIRFSEKNHSFVDIAKGDELKIHKKPISLFGGLGMFVSMVFGVALLFDPSATTVILGALPVFILGYWDDFKWKHVTTIRPLFKFFLLIVSCLASALILLFFGISFNFIPISIIPLFFSFCMIFILINAVNYQDGIDGLAGSLVFISILGFSVVGFFIQSEFILTISLISLASIAAFLIFNLFPAKIFMGDSGAYALGFLLSAIAITIVKPYNLLTIFGIIFIIGLPLFDGVFTNVRRIMSGKSIFLGDRSHFYDKLMKGGFSVWKTLFICCFIQIFSVIIGIFLLIYA